jgi:hypothetical protein
LEGSRAAASALAARSRVRGKKREGERDDGQETESAED